MSKTEKELAFLRDLYIESDFTERFTNIFDDNFKFSDEETILYVNAGAGNHALALREKLDDKIEIFGVSENQELLNIASHKAAAIQANVDFSIVYPVEKFDAVLADATLVKQSELKSFLAKIIESANNQVAFFLPTTSSYGEIFSLLWETFLALDLLDKGAAVERLITDLPTTLKLEEMAGDSGLKKIETIVKSESFEFEDGEIFINSTLAADFLFPMWFGFLDEEERTSAIKKLAEMVDEDRGGLNFQFSVKATLLVGGKK